MDIGGMVVGEGERVDVEEWEFFEVGGVEVGVGGDMGDGRGVGGGRGMGWRGRG